MQPFGRKVSSEVLNTNSKTLFKDLITIQEQMDTLETELEKHRLLSALEHQSMYSALYKKEAEVNTLIGQVEDMRIPDIEDPVNPPLSAYINPLYRYATVPTVSNISRAHYIHPQTNQVTWDTSNSIMVTPDKMERDIETEPKLGVVGDFNQWYTRIRHSDKSAESMELTYHVDISSAYSSNYDSNRFTFHPYPFGCTIEELSVFGEGSWEDIAIPEGLGNTQLLFPLRDIEQVKIQLSSSISLPLGQEYAQAIGVRHINWEKVHFVDGAHHLYFVLPLPEETVQITESQLDVINNDWLPNGLISMTYQTWNSGVKQLETSTLPLITSEELLVVDVAISAHHEIGIAPQIRSIQLQYEEVE